MRKRALTPEAENTTNQLTPMDNNNIPFESAGYHPQVLNRPFHRSCHWQTPSAPKSRLSQSTASVK